MCCFFALVRRFRCDDDDDDDEDLFCVVSALTFVIRPSEAMGSFCSPFSGALCPAFMPWSGDSDDDDDDGDDLFCVVSALTFVIRLLETMGSSCSPFSGALCSAFMPWSGDSDVMMMMMMILFCVVSALTFTIRPLRLPRVFAPRSQAHFALLFCPGPAIPMMTDDDDDLFCVVSALTLLIRPSETTAGFCSIVLRRTLPCFYALVRRFRIR